MSQDALSTETKIGVLGLGYVGLPLPTPWRSISPPWVTI